MRCLCRRRDLQELIVLHFLLEGGSVVSDECYRFPHLTRLAASSSRARGGGGVPALKCTIRLRIIDAFREVSNTLFLLFDKSCVIELTISAPPPSKEFKFICLIIWTLSASPWVLLASPILLFRALAGFATSSMVSPKREMRCKTSLQAWRR